MDKPNVKITIRKNFIKTNHVNYTDLIDQNVPINNQIDPIGLNDHRTIGAVEMIYV